MEINTEKFQSTVNRLKATGGKGARNYAGLELTAELAKNTGDEIPVELLKIATPKEYSMSRLWRAKDIPDMIFRALFDWYYRLIDFPILKYKLGLNASKPF